VYHDWCNRPGRPATFGTLAASLHRVVDLDAALLHFLEEQVSGHITLLEPQKANPLSALIVPKHHRGVIAAACLV